MNLELAMPHPLELYRWSVQDPETHASLLRLIYERLRPGRTPAVLREDFAGNAADSVAWVGLKPTRSAIAVDLDADALAWGRARASRIIGNRSERIRFVEGDAIHPDPSTPPADIAIALNYSLMYLHDRNQLLAYLAGSRRGLDRAGVFVCNLFGGPDATRPSRERRRITPTPRFPTERPIAPFEYEWEVRDHDPSTRVTDCRVHFRLDPPESGGRAIELTDAFRYPFKLWTPREITDACLEAGFTDAAPWRHTLEPRLPPPGVFLGPVDPAFFEGPAFWDTYIVACR